MLHLQWEQNSLIDDLSVVFIIKHHKKLLTKAYSFLLVICYLRAIKLPYQKIRFMFPTVLRSSNCNQVPAQKIYTSYMNREDQYQNTSIAGGEEAESTL